MSESPSIEFKSAIPNLLVADVPAATAFYVEKLGFTQTMTGQNFAVIARDSVTLGLIGSTTGAGKSWCYITVSNPASLFEQIKQAGVTILQELETWGDHTEFSIADLEGNRIDVGN